MANVEAGKTKADLIILAFDPGSDRTGYAKWNHTKQILMDSGDEDNYKLLGKLDDWRNEPNLVFAYEMPELIGQSNWSQILETCWWAGRFAEVWSTQGVPQRVTRREVKLSILGRTNVKGADSAIKQVLIQRFARNVSNHGKGSKKEPGPFYGLAGDAWQALAVAVTYGDNPKEESN